MRTTADYLDALQQHFGVTSDYGLERHTGWKRQYISRYRNKKSTFSDDTCIKIAEWTGAPLSEVLLDMLVQRATSERVRREWETVAKKLSGVAALLMLAVLSSPFPAEAAARVIHIMSS